MTDIDVAEAESVLKSAEKFVSDIDREDEDIEELEEKMNDLRYEVRHDSGKLEEATKEVKDLMEKIEEGSIHDEPEMTPEKEREAREEGPREDEYSS